MVQVQDLFLHAATVVPEVVATQVLAAAGRQCCDAACLAGWLAGWLAVELAGGLAS